MNYLNIHEMARAASEILPPEVYAYLAGGADDKRTISRNQWAYQSFQLRPRRLRNVTHIDTSVQLFDATFPSPIILAPVGVQRLFHPDGELASARAAHARKHLMMVSTVANTSFPEVAKAFDSYKPWFQLYATTNREKTKYLIQMAEKAGAPAVVLTIDVPVLGNRENHTRQLLSNIYGGDNSLGNFQNIPFESNETFHDPSMTWDIIDWIKNNCNMKVLVKGILHPEDAKLAITYGADGVIVSNHGGRQLESDCSTIEVLPEIVTITNGKIPVLIDGGIRRGTDILKALAIGANAVCIGRPMCYGLALGGQAGVEHVLTLLQQELIRGMQLLGVTSLAELDYSYVRKIIPTPT